MKLKTETYKIYLVPCVISSLLPPHIQDFVLSLVELNEVLYLSPACQSPFGWQHKGVSATPSSFESAANLLGVHSAPSSRSLLKLLKRTGPSSDPHTAATHPTTLCSVITALWTQPFDYFSVHLTVCSLSPYLTGSLRGT